LLTSLATFEAALLFRFNCTTKYDNIHGTYDKVNQQSFKCFKTIHIPSGIKFINEHVKCYTDKNTKEYFCPELCRVKF